MRFAYQYRLYSKQAQVQFLENQLHEACELYNAAFQERRDAWNVCRKSIHYYDQAKQLKPKGCSDWPTSPAARCAPPARRRSDHAGILPHPRSVTAASRGAAILPVGRRSEEHTSELQSLTNLVCRLLLEKKKKTKETI